MIRQSIRFRVALASAGFLVCMLAVAGVFAVREMTEAMFATVDGGHRRLAKRIGLKIAQTPSLDGLDQWMDAATGADNPFSSLRYWIWEEGHTSPALTHPDGPEGTTCLDGIKEAVISEGDRSRRFMLKPDGRQEFRGYIRRIDAPRGAVYIALASPSGPIYAERDGFVTTVLILAGPTILLAVLCTVWLVKWGLRPIAQTAHRLQNVLTSSDLPQFNIRPADVPTELRPFVDAVRGLLGRLGVEIDKQKQFTGDAAHELRTPLAVAKSTVQLALQQDRHAGEYRQALGETLEDLERMEQLINQLLCLARLDASEDPTPVENVRLDKVLRDLADALTPRLRGGQQIVVDDLPEVVISGDIEQIERLFGNILDNAVQHGSEEGTIRVQLVAQPGGACTATIHDGGGSIAPDAWELVFDRFFRTDKSRSRRNGGTGLGLAIARQITLRHGGGIRLRSAPGEGTDLIVEFPCVS